MSAPDELRQLADRLIERCVFGGPDDECGNCDTCVAAVALRHHANLLDAMQAHRDAPDNIRFKGYKAGRFSAADTHLYAALDAAAAVSPPPAPTTCPKCGSDDPDWVIDCTDPADSWHQAAT